MTMDANLTLNDLRILVTVISFVVFAAIVYWAWSSRQKKNFEEAANLPFVDDDLPAELPVNPPLESRHNSGARS